MLLSLLARTIDSSCSSLLSLRIPTFTVVPSPNLPEGSVSTFFFFSPLFSVSSGLGWMWVFVLLDFQQAFILHYIIFFLHHIILSTDLSLFLDNFCIERKASVSHTGERANSCKNCFDKREGKRKINYLSHFIRSIKPWYQNWMGTL